MSKPKSQHWVPKCYLREFVDPNTPENQEPYLWIVERNKKYKKKKAPQNICKEADLYTIQIPGKEKSYVIEESLSAIEGKYADIFRKKIKNKLPLSPYDHTILCYFVGAMLLRTLRHKQNFDHFIDQIVERTESLEHQHGIPHKESEKWKSYKANAHGISLADTLPDIAKLLGKMSLAFLCVDVEKSSRFITSDDPCNLFNPELQWQKFYGPGLRMKDTQITMALSPEIMLCMSWSNFKGYIKWPASLVEESNRMIRAYCNEYFLSHTSKIKWRWFLSFPLDFFFIIKMIRILSWQKLQRTKRLFSNYKYRVRR